MELFDKSPQPSGGPSTAAIGLIVFLVGVVVAIYQASQGDVLMAFFVVGIFALCAGVIGRVGKDATDVAEKQ